jgi:hypothetical protein
MHVTQFREGLRRSEVAAERWANRVLTSWRSRPIASVHPAGQGRGPEDSTAQLALFP